VSSYNQEQQVYFGRSFSKLDVQRSPLAWKWQRSLRPLFAHSDGLGLKVGDSREFEDAGKE
jgi:hypothetical protein